MIVEKQMEYRLAGETEVLDQNMLDLVGVQEIRWDNGGTEQTGGVHFYMERGKES
jgi:hypothetical protein